MKNYSRQREAVLNVLCSTDTHPTAPEVYSMVKKEIPNISLGTVYRNLAALSESGEILSLTFGDGFEHYDGNITPHLHLICRKCGRIKDFPYKSVNVSAKLKDAGFMPENEVHIVYGICAECNND